MNTRKILVRAVAGAAIAVMALMPGEAFAFLGLFESKPTQAEMEKVDSLFKDYYRSNDVESAIAVLPTVKKIGKMKPGGIPPVIGFYFGAAKSSLATHRAEWEAAKKRGGKEIAYAIGAALDGKALGDMVPPDLADYAPGILDFLWGYFLATGDAEAPRRRVTMHIEDLTDRVKEWSSLTRLEFNRKLEEWYNEEPQTNADGPSLTLGIENASVSSASSTKVCG